MDGWKKVFTPLPVNFTEAHKIAPPCPKAPPSFPQTEKEVPFLPVEPKEISFLSPEGRILGQESGPVLRG